MESHEVWQQIFRDVRDNALLYLKSPAIQEKYKNPKTHINLWVDDGSYAINARAKKIAEDQYDICIYAGLIAALENETRAVLREYPIIFHGIDRSDAKKVGMAESALLYQWMDFICCHEWAHVICGHLEFDDRVSAWYEIETKEAPQRQLEVSISQSLEAEADSYASKFSLGRFSTYWKYMAKKLYGKADGKTALRDYMLGLLFLFQFFDKLQAGESERQDTHPTPFNRAYVMMAFIQGHYPAIPDLPKVSMEDNDNPFAEAVIDFYVKALKRDASDYLMQSFQATLFMERVGKTLETIRIRKHRLFIQAP